MEDECQLFPYDKSQCKGPRWGDTNAQHEVSRFLPVRREFFLPTSVLIVDCLIVGFYPKYCRVYTLIIKYLEATVVVIWDYFNKLECFQCTRVNVFFVKYVKQLGYKIYSAEFFCVKHIRLDLLIHAVFIILFSQKDLVKYVTYADMTSGTTVFGHREFLSHLLMVSQKCSVFVCRLSRHRVTIYKLDVHCNKLYRILQ